MEVRYEKENTARAAGTHLTDLLTSNLDKDVLLLLSGGSAFALLEYVDPKSLNNKVIVMMLDERISNSASSTNFYNLKRHPFYTEALKQHVDFFDLGFHVEDPLEKSSRRFGKYLKAWKKIHPDGVSIATMGMGEDGHTAGIMPFPEDKAQFGEMFDTKDTLTACYDAGNKNPYPLRCTVTNTFLRNNVDHAIGYVVGEPKADILKRVLVSKGLNHTYPARVIFEMPDVTLYTDIPLEK